MGPLDPHGPRCGAPAAPPSRGACLIPIDYMINRNTFSIYFRYTEQIDFGTVIIKSLVEMSFQITLLERCCPIDM